MFVAKELLFGCVRMCILVYSKNIAYNTKPCIYKSNSHGNNINNFIERDKDLCL